MTFGTQVSLRGTLPSETTMGPLVHSQNSLDQFPRLHGVLSRRVHELNNLITAFNCLWDSTNRSTGPSSEANSSRRRLQEVVDQLQSSFQAFRGESADLLSQLDALSGCSHPATSISESHQSVVRSPPTSDQATEQGHTTDNLKDRS
jgi:hypothetical protein